MSVGGERLLVRRCSRDQAGLRAAVLALPLLASMSSVVVGESPRWWVLILVGCLSAWWAVRPESAVGVASLAVVMLWWAHAADQLTWWFALPGGLLFGAHLAATVSAFAPGEATIAHTTVRRWTLRWVLLSLCCPLVVAGLWAGDSLGGVASTHLWPWAVVAVLALGGAGLAYSTNGGD